MVPLEPLRRPLKGDRLAGSWWPLPCEEGGGGVSLVRVPPGVVGSSLMAGCLPNKAAKLGLVGGAGEVAACCTEPDAPEAAMAGVFKTGPLEPVPAAAALAEAGGSGWSSEPLLECKL